MKDRITPRFITKLADNEIFVFGKDIHDSWSGEAAMLAEMYFGAERKQGEGLHGSSYAIPTMDSDIGRYVQNFIEFARKHPELHFLVTEIEQDKPENIAPLFLDAANEENISMPESYWEALHGIKNQGDCDSVDECFINNKHPIVPIYNSYRVANRFFAGEYPCCDDEEESKARIKALIDFGITAFIDLTQENESTKYGIPLRPYSQWLPENIVYQRFYISKNHVPKRTDVIREHMIDKYLNEGAIVYLHCSDGVGRTSTVVMRWIISFYKRHTFYLPNGDIKMDDYTFHDIFEKFKSLWQYFPKAKIRKPLNSEQQHYIESIIARNNTHVQWHGSIGEDIGMDVLYHDFPERFNTPFWEEIHKIMSQDNQ